MEQLLKMGTFASNLAENVAKKMQWLSPIVARLTVGLVFFQSGWGKLNDLGKVTEFFTNLGLPAPAFQAVLASTTELVCGGLLIAGLATRFAAVPLIITMIVAIRTALWEQVEGISSLVGLLEFAYIALLLWLATHGAGPLSADALLAPRTDRHDAGAMKLALSERA